jgi:hypothetical protein
MLSQSLLPLLAILILTTTTPSYAVTIPFPWFSSPTQTATPSSPQPAKPSYLRLPIKRQIFNGTGAWPWGWHWSPPPSWVPPPESLWPPFAPPGMATTGTGRPAPTIPAWPRKPVTSTVSSALVSGGANSGDSSEDLGRAADVSSLSTATASPATVSAVQMVPATPVPPLQGTATRPLSRRASPGWGWAHLLDLGGIAYVIERVFYSLSLPPRLKTLRYTPLQTMTQASQTNGAK